MHEIHTHAHTQWVHRPKWKRIRFFYRKIEIDMVVVIVVDDGALAGSVLVCVFFIFSLFFAADCWWLAECVWVWCVCENHCTIHLWFSSPHSFNIPTRPNRVEYEWVCFVEFLCTFYVIFAPVCADGLLHHTVQFIYIHMLKFYKRKRRRNYVDANGRKMQGNAFVLGGFGQHACPFSFHTWIGYVRHPIGSHSGTAQIFSSIFY